MENGNRLNFWRLLLLALHLSAITFAIPSCTEPQFHNHGERHPTYPIRSSPAASSRLGAWSKVYRFFYTLLERTSKHRQASEPDFVAQVAPEELFSSKFQPSRQLLAKYGDQLVLRFNVSTESEAKSLAEVANTLYLDIWGQSDSWVDIRLAKAVVPSLLGLLPDSLQHAHTALMQGSGLARAVLETYPASPSSESDYSSKWRLRSFSSSTGTKSRGDETYTELFFDDYRPLAMIKRWMSMMESIFPSHVRVISVGSSYEGRDIPAIRVGARPRNNEGYTPPRDTIVISGGQHAREWISTSTVSYVAHSLIAAYGEDPEITDLLDSLDIVFVPSLNPDGYQYTWDADRLWRKNRQPTTLPFCRGIDLDRSWSYMWDGERTKNNPCSESFAGEVAFDAVESQHFAEWAKNETANNNVTFIGLIDLHSYSQEILYPYSYTCETEPPTLEDLQELGEGLAKSIRSMTGEHYNVESACEGNVAINGGRISPRLEGGGGSLLDWFYHEMGVRKAFQIKLRDKGSYGFLLPREHIIPTGLEILSLVQHFANAVSSSSGSRGPSAPIPEEYQAAMAGDDL